MGVLVNFDTTSMVLMALIACTLMIGILLRPPPPQLHPFLLGRQSIPSQSRVQGESAIYLNSVTAGTRPPVRPDKDVKTVWDVLQPSVARFGPAKAGTWVEGGEKINEVVVALRAGLLSTLGQGEGQVAVLVEDPTGARAASSRDPPHRPPPRKALTAAFAHEQTDALLVTLALILTNFTPLVVTPGSILPSSASVVGIISSASVFTPAAALSSSPDAKHMSLGGEDSSIAEDLLATGKQLVANGEASEIKAVEPSAVALTIVSDGTSLAFTHQVSQRSASCVLSTQPCR